MIEILMTINSIALTIIAIVLCLLYRVLKEEKEG